MFRAIFTSDMHHSNKLLRSHASSDRQTMKHSHQKAFFLKPSCHQTVRVKIWYTTVYFSKSKALNSAQRFGLPSTETAADIPQTDFSQQMELMFYRNIKYLEQTFFFEALLYFYLKYNLYLFDRFSRTIEIRR